jgi:hypothetical protein
MRAFFASPAGLLRNAMLLCAMALPCAAQSTAPAPSSSASSDEGVVLDRVVAVVNGDLILESDVDEERRFEAFQPFTRAGETFSRPEAIRRLIDRSLILQQAQLQPGEEITDAQVQAELEKLRKEIPACHPAHCETDAGWKKFVEAQGMTLDELAARWKQRMEVLQFIEMRFRMGIRIQPEEIQAYYDKTLLPEYAKQHATPPKLDAISDRIQEILLQQRVGRLLDDWLKSLRAQGSVRMIKPDEEAP